jgi:hypothetical protein
MVFQVFAKKMIRLHEKLEANVFSHKGWTGPQRSYFWGIRGCPYSLAL